MGDVGSSPLGFLLAALPFSLPAGSRETAVFATGIFLWFFLSDGLFTLLARLVRGEKIWTAHRSHLYQRLVITGIAHDSVVIPVGGTAVVLVCLAAFSSRYQLPVWQWFAVHVPQKTVGVKGDYRVYEDVCVVRLVSSQDAMTADWELLPVDALRRISSRILNEVKGYARVCLDISSKPPATIEWE